MGPGTHVIEKIRRHIIPNDRNDFVSMTHDVNYLISGGDHVLMDKADDLAISNTDFSLKGLVMSSGLRLRKILHLKEDPNSIRLGLALKDSILDDNDYKQQAMDYGFDLNAMFLPE